MTLSNSPPREPEEEIEGVEQDEDASWGDYPIDTVLIRTETRTVHDVLRRIEKGSFILNPDFQRDFIWEDDKQSKLIESVLMRIPLPVFYLAEDPQGNMIVVDGLQRLSTFKRFADDKLTLRLPDQPELNRKRFRDLSPKLQNRIEDCNLALYVIDAKVPERARLDIFERVNGGVPLSRQQMRNCIYMGPATLFLRDEASTPIFLKATGESLRTTNMRDREFVNRFCSFQILGYEKYTGSMDEFLAEGLKRMNQMEKSALSELSNEFRNALRNNYRVFDRHAFRKHNGPDGKRSVLNASLWDVMSTVLADYPEHVIEARKNAIQEAFYELMDDEDFNQAITYSVNQVGKVETRFTLAEAAFEEVLDANTD